MSEIDPGNLRIFVRQQLLPPPRIKMSEMIASEWPPVSSLILNWSVFFFFPFFFFFVKHLRALGSVAVADPRVLSMLDIGWNFICRVVTVRVFVTPGLTSAATLLPSRVLKKNWFSGEFSSRSLKKMFQINQKTSVISFFWMRVYLFVLETVRGARRSHAWPSIQRTGGLWKMSATPAATSALLAHHGSFVFFTSPSLPRGGWLV